MDETSRNKLPTYFSIIQVKLEKIPNIFATYTYFQHLGGFLPILKGRKTSKIKPEFVIFDPLRGEIFVIFVTCFINLILDPLRSEIILVYIFAILDPLDWRRQIVGIDISSWAENQCLLKFAQIGQTSFQVCSDRSQTSQAMAGQTSFPKFKGS